MLVDVARPVGLARLEHRAQDAVLAGQGAEGGDQLVAHARREKACETALAVRQAERRVARPRELARAVDEALQHLVHGQLGGDGEDGVAEGLQGGAERLGDQVTLPVPSRVDGDGAVAAEQPEALRAQRALGRGRAAGGEEAALPVDAAVHATKRTPSPTRPRPHESPRFRRAQRSAASGAVVEYPCGRSRGAWRA